MKESVDNFDVEVKSGVEGEVEGMRLLIRIECRETLCRVEEALCQVDFDLYFVSDDRRMMALVQLGCIDMVIVDLRDQGLTGLNRLKVLQAEPASARLPLICFINEEHPTAARIRLTSVGVDCERIKFMCAGNCGNGQEIIDKESLLLTMDSFALVTNSTSQ